MQMNQLFRQGIVTPLNREAENQFDRGTLDENTSVEFLRIESGVDFLDLYQSGFFCNITAGTGIPIGEYEEDKIPSHLVPKLREIVTEFTNHKYAHSDRRAFLSKLLRICDMAIEREMPVYFVL